MSRMVSRPLPAPWPSASGWALLLQPWLSIPLRSASSSLSKRSSAVFGNTQSPKNTDSTTVVSHTDVSANQSVRHKVTWADVTGPEFLEYLHRSRDAAQTRWSDGDRSPAHAGTPAGPSRRRAPARRSHPLAARVQRHARDLPRYPQPRLVSKSFVPAPTTSWPSPYRGGPWPASHGLLAPGAQT